MASHTLAWTLALGCVVVLSHAASIPDVVEDEFCTRPFKMIGGRCLLVDDILLASWLESSMICRDLHAHLVHITDMNLLADIVDHIKANGLDDRCYWTSASDAKEEGVWVWGDGSPVRMNTPLWGDNPDEIQEPTGGDEEDCGALVLQDHWYLHDEACSNLHGVICEKDIQASTATRVSNITSCPPPYNLVGGRCIFVDPIGNKHWTQMHTFCHDMKGDMLKLDDANLLGAIYDYLTTREGYSSSYYWVGATDSVEEGTWRWTDGSPVRMGTPFWGDTSAGIQAPDGGEEHDCAFLKPSDHFFMNDYRCEGDDANNFGVICEFLGDEQ